MWKKIISLALCLSMLAALPALAEERLTVTVGMEKESVATFEENRTFSGSGTEGDVVNIFVYREGLNGRLWVRTNYELVLGASRLFSQSVPLSLGENRVEISDGADTYSVTVRRYKQALKEELETGISVPGQGGLPGGAGY